MRIRIEAHDLPGRSSSRHENVHVGVQRRGRNDDVLDPVPADVDTARWEFEVTVRDADGTIELRGPYVQGSPGARFIYLSWGTVDDATFTMFGRSKLMLAEVDAQTMAAAVAAGTLTGRVGLRDERGRLRMAAVKPPAIVWSAG